MIKRWKFSNLELYIPTATTQQRFAPQILFTPPPNMAARRTGTASHENLVNPKPTNLSKKPAKPILFHHRPKTQAELNEADMKNCFIPPHITRRHEARASAATTRSSRSKPVLARLRRAATQLNSDGNGRKANSQADLETDT